MSIPAVLIDDLIDMALKNKGVALIEAWVCRGCGMECFEIHPMCEVVSCSKCGLRVASRLPRYQSVCDIAADHC